ncbi:MAG: hypothetical protein ACRYFS_08540 [Janthinobacterium lividum]
MFPDLPYPGFSWSLTHHMVAIHPIYLYQTLYAAATYSNSLDPAQEINNYLNTHRLLTSNIRDGQPDTWRDYQQILPELGLMFSTEVQRAITPTSIGLSYLDGAIGFSDVVTMQALRYQYPNGYKTDISRTLRLELAQTPYATARKLAELQRLTGVQLRPAVLTWRVLQELNTQSETPVLTINEIQSYLLRCSTHNDLADCVGAIIRARGGGASLPLEPVMHFVGLFGLICPWRG